MKEYQIKFENIKNRKTVSDLKLKKIPQTAIQECELNKINNSFKFKPPKLTPIVGQITIIPIKPQAAIVKQMLLGKQAMKMRKQFGRFQKINQDQRKYIKTEAIQKLKQQQRFSDTSRVVYKQQLKKFKQKLQTKTMTLTKQTYKTKNSFHANLKTNFPKIVTQQKYKSTKHDSPMLSALDSNLRNIKSLHYFVLQNQTQIPVISYRSKIKIEVASLTKIMTFYVINKICQQFNIKPKQVQVPIQYQMTDISGTTALLQQNQVYTLQQLLYGLMLPSGNDASLALAIWGGRKLKSIAQAETDNCNPVKQFINRMNIQAKQLKMFDSSYGNPHGLPHRDNRTTCQDIAKLCSKCLQIQLFRQVVQTKVYQFKFYHKVFKKKLASHWQNTNKLLRRPGFIGIKTGITVTAGPCLASAYQFLGKTYIVVIAKSNKPSRRFKQTRKILVHCLQRIDHGRQLQQDQLNILKKLGRQNQDIDSDYSEEEHQFNFSSFNSQQIQRRTRILTQV